jgi:hypothetical protein
LVGSGRKNSIIAGGKHFDDACAAEKGAVDLKVFQAIVVEIYEEATANVALDGSVDDFGGSVGGAGGDGSGDGGVGEEAFG